MNLAQRQKQWTDRLTALPDPQQRLWTLTEAAEWQPGLAPDQRCERYLVEGCLADLWVVPSLDRGRCRFRCDSESLIVKGVAGLLCTVYSGSTPAEILEHPPHFLREAGITAHLTANRRNALTRVWEVIRLFAASHLEAEP